MVNHLAIIMDGNGRWAEERGLSRSDGHRAGARQIGVAARAAMNAGIKYLTLYAFSTENWKRPKDEVTVLMELISEFAKSELPNMLRDGVRLRTIGRTADLPPASRAALEFAIKQTANNDKLTINIALSYGGRAEIVDAVNKIIAEKRTAPVTEQDFVSYLYAPDIPDPDLLIRTGGEMRLSNFLLWELSYAELYVTETYWPDFTEETLEQALASFGGRKRRFGGLNKK
ncbi:MAG: di-trans,poly-cis-decaprenylcistransferase [Lentisphaerae bacterium]|nr:di-trans,poly-cis-decaprenylcistransferase [Lentisphaerota bacterium]MBR2873465.1 di-trans,poly-cis-decaprenylcistransferase [Lentisphaeria bacterium]